MNWVGYGRKWSLPNLRCYLDIWRDKKLRKNLRTVGVTVEFRTGHILNRSRKPACSVGVILLSDAVITHSRIGAFLTDKFIVRLEMLSSAVIFNKTRQWNSDQGAISVKMKNTDIGWSSVLESAHSRDILWLCFGEFSLNNWSQSVGYKRN
jgi:hypothetical protein